MMMRLIYLSQLVVVFFGITMKIHAVLDGRAAPIYLESRYTFTNYEWAKGLVYFKQGFDLPAHGTAFLDITHKVEKSINLKNGTLVLLGDLILSADSSITGSGYIDARGKRLFFMANWQPLPSERYFFTSDVIFQGIGSNKLDLVGSGPSGGIFFNQNVLVTFASFGLGPIGWNAFKTSTYAPVGIYFIDSTIYLRYESLTLSSFSVAMSGNINVLGGQNRILKCTNSLGLTPFTTLNISPNTGLHVSQLFSSSVSGMIILDNAKMLYTPQAYVFSPTATSRLFFAKTWQFGEHAGTLIVKGSCGLEIPSGMEIYFSDKSILQLESGARLNIISGGKINIY